MDRQESLGDEEGEKQKWARRHRELAERLLEAIERGDEPAALAALEEGAYPRSQRLGRWKAGPFEGASLSALELAALGGMEGVARELASRLKSTEPRGDASRFAWTVALMAVPGGKGVETMIKAVGRQAMREGSAREMVGWVCRGGHELELRLLLKGGASPSDTETTSPLLWAAREGHEGCAQALVDYGADVDEVDEDGDSALAVLASKGYAEGVKLLLRLGADPLKKGPSGYTALHAASRFGEFECVRELAPVSDIWARTREGELASLLARRAGCEESAALLAALERSSEEKAALEGELAPARSRPAAGL